MQVGLLEESTLDINYLYLMLIVSSCTITTFRLLSSSAAVIIAMILAALMLPIRGLAFAVLAGNVFTNMDKKLRNGQSIRITAMPQKKRW